MCSVFISHRTDDNTQVHYFYKLLSDWIGDEEVFLDQASIEPSKPFPQHVRRAAETCKYMLVMIGPQWAEHLKKRYTSDDPRNQSERDWVRTEIAIAIHRGIPVLPIMVGGVGRFPSEEVNQFAPELDLFSYVGHVVRSNYFQQDAGQVKDLIAGYMNSEHPYVITVNTLPYRWKSDIVCSVKVDNDELAKFSIGQLREFSIPIGKHTLLISYYGEIRGYGSTASFYFDLKSESINFTASPSGTRTFRCEVVQPKDIFSRIFRFRQLKVT